MRIKACIGYTIAIMAIPVTLATFLGMNFFSHKLVDVTGIKVSPWFTGAEVMKTIEHEGYQTLLHRPVFDGLFTEKLNGFVQIDWEPGNSLPPEIIEDIDYNADSITDFRIEYDTQTNTAKLTSYSQNVLSLEGSYILKERRAVRIKIVNYHF